MCNGVKQPTRLHAPIEINENHAGHIQFSIFFLNSRQAQWFISLYIYVEFPFIDNVFGGKHMKDKTFLHINIEYT